MNKVIKGLFVAFVIPLGVLLALHFIPIDTRDRDQLLALAEHDLKQANDKEDRFYALTNAARSAADANQFPKATIYAKELLQLSLEFQGNWNFGNAIHHGHIALGRAALFDGHIEDANLNLLKAGRTPGSPQLNSFGPNMSLARELLKHGEHDVVLEYFQNCRKFWKGGDSELSLWTWEVKLGLIPGFGPNLFY